MTLSEFKTITTTAIKMLFNITTIEPTGITTVVKAAHEPFSEVEKNSEVRQVIIKPDLVVVATLIVGGMREC